MASDSGARPAKKTRKQENEEEEADQEEEEKEKEEENKDEEEEEEEEDHGAVQIWMHPVFGMFKLIEEDEDDYRWTNQITMPGTFWKNADSDSDGEQQIEIEIYAMGEEDGKKETQPDPRYIDLLQHIVDNCTRLGVTLQDEFFQEISGARPGNMWWSNKTLDEFKKVIREVDIPQQDVDKLQTGQDLSRFMMQPSLAFFEALPKFGVDRLCAAVEFYPEFEEEHGVSLITDGEHLLASGYATNAM